MEVLIVLTSHDRLGDTGNKTGFWLEEFAAPYYLLKDAGIQVTLASPDGGQPPLDPKSHEPDFQTEATRRGCRHVLRVFRGGERLVRGQQDQRGQQRGRRQDPQGLGARRPGQPHQGQEGLLHRQQGLLPSHAGGGHQQQVQCPVACSNQILFVILTIPIHNAV